MGKKNNRTCIICGNSYHFCPTCGEDAGKPTWYFIFDGQNCHDIYEVCTQYRDGEIDAKVAYEKISKLDISNTFIADFLCCYFANKFCRNHNIINETIFSISHCFKIISWLR